MREKQVEKMLVTVVAVLLLVLNVLMVMKYDAVFSVVAADYACAETDEVCRKKAAGYGDVISSTDLAAA